MAQKQFRLPLLDAEKTIEDTAEVYETLAEMDAKGHEEEKEGEERCRICIKQRLFKTMKKAKELGMDVFGTTLTVSPHKDSLMINQFGKFLAIENKIDFLVSDFKKNDGYKKSVELSKKHGLYRQDYCGCEFSRKKLL